MALTLQQMRDFVRTHADADATDAPDATLDVYARIAYNDIHTRTNFPLLQTSDTFTTVAGQSEYTFASIGDLNKITAVIDSQNLGRSLIYISESDGDLAFGAPVGMSSDVATAYTVYNDVLKLYPKPSVSGKIYTVRGLRNPASWPNGSGSSPDLPVALHDAISWYMLSSYYLSQEDVNLAGVYLREYEQMVDKFVRNESFKDFGARNHVMGGQNYYAPNFTRWVRGMLE
jgi:hypothetical protein